MNTPPRKRMKMPHEIFVRLNDLEPGDYFSVNGNMYTDDLEEYLSHDFAVELLKEQLNNMEAGYDYGFEYDADDIKDIKNPRFLKHWTVECLCGKKGRGNCVFGKMHFWHEDDDDNDVIPREVIAVTYTKLTGLNAPFDMYEDFGILSL